MTLMKGDRVMHPNKTDWGLGEILDVSNNRRVKVFFVGCGEKTVSLEHVTLEKISEPEANHPLLDNLNLRGAEAYQTLNQSIDRFLKLFPSGFYDAKFSEHERDYKTKAHDLALETLAEEEFGILLANSKFDEICDRAFRISNATNLIFPNEKMSLRDGLQDVKDKEEFARSLFDLIYRTSSFEKRFYRWVDFLEKIGAAKWTIATYYLFIFKPEHYIFLKPTVTKNAAEISGFEIQYRPELNLRTYELVQKFAKYLMAELVDLKPRDLIDIQSFMWCIAPNKY